MSIKQVFVSAVTDSHSTDVEGVGTLRFEADGKVYKYVKNNDTANGFAAGYFACHTVGDGATANTAIKLPATANLGLMGGIVASTTLTANTGTLPKIYGWIQVAGIVSTAQLPQGTVTAGTEYIPTNGQAYGTALAAAGITSSHYTRLFRLIDNGSLSAVGTFANVAYGEIVGCK